MLFYYLKLSFDVGLVNQGMQNIEDAKDIPCLVLSVQSINLRLAQLGSAGPETFWTKLIYCRGSLKIPIFQIANTFLIEIFSLNFISLILNLKLGCFSVIK